MRPWARRTAPSLRSALLLRVVAPTLGLLLGLGVWIGVAVERQAEERMRENLTLIAQSIRAPIAQAVQRGDWSTMQSVLDGAFETEPVFGVYVHDEQHNLVAAIGSVRLLADRRAEVQRIEDAAIDGFESPRAERDVYSVFLPLTDAGGRIRGMLQVSRDLSSWRAERRVFRTQLALLGLVVGLTLALALWWGHRAVIGRPLERLLAALDAIAPRAAPRRGAALRRHAKGRSLPRTRSPVAEVDDGRVARLPASGAPALEWMRVEAAINAMLDRRDALAEVAEQSRLQRYEAERRAAQAERLAVIGRAAGGIAHELGTPLGVVVGRLERLERKLSSAQTPAPSALREIAALRGEIERIASIVRSLLAFSRGDIAPQTVFDPEAAVTEVADRVRSQSAEQGRALRWERPPVDTAPERVARLCGDAQRFRVLVRNLFDNAARFAERRVRWTTGVADGRWWLRVEDDGPGVRPELASRIFEPFVSFEPAAPSPATGSASTSRISEAQPTAARGSCGASRCEISLDDRRDPVGAGRPARGGAGLGLALAAAITQELGGQLECIDPRSGSADASAQAPDALAAWARPLPGGCFVLRVPLAAATPAGAAADGAATASRPGAHRDPESAA